MKTLVLKPVNEPTFEAHLVNVTAYGAVGDGKCINTEAFKHAIESVAEVGGGTVLVPRGDWLTGPIHLRSHVRLHLERGATVHFSTRHEDYLPVVFTRWEGVECFNYSPLIYAYKCTNLAVTGEGVFHGHGEAWWHWKQLQHPAVKVLYHSQTNGVPPEQRIYGTKSAALRPQFIQFVDCQDVLVEGVTFRDGPFWTIHPVYCDNVVVRKVRVESFGPNTDGLNPDSCSNVLIEDCYFDTGDDSIAINSGMNDDGWRVNRPCENIEVRGCSFKRNHGAIVIGSAMSGGVRNVYAHNCTCDGSDRGLRIKSMRGRGGFVEDVLVEHITMKNIVHEAILLSMAYDASSAPPSTNAVPAFRRIIARDIQCEGAETAIAIHGLPDSIIDDVELLRLDIRARNGTETSHVSNLKTEGVIVQVYE